MMTDLHDITLESDDLQDITLDSECPLDITLELTDLIEEDGIDPISELESDGFLAVSPTAVPSHSPLHSPLPDHGIIL